MDPQLLPRFLSPIINGKADYVKGNRFTSIESVRQMPALRLFGNSLLSLLCKLSSGYWHLFDPNNGYVCCHAEVLRRLPLNKIAQRYFFESDMLFRLGVARALVIDVPMGAVYGDEQSSPADRTRRVTVSVQSHPQFRQTRALPVFHSGLQHRERRNCYAPWRCWPSDLE